MAVNTTGNKNIDSIYTGELCMEAMQFSKNILNKNGKFISKIFKENKVYKPLASRKGSKENFIICKFLR